MKYPKEYLDEIKTRLKVSTVVSKTVKLKKRGKEFVGLSPLRQRKLHHSQSWMNKNFIIVLVQVSTEIFLILL